MVEEKERENRQRRTDGRTWYDGKVFNCMYANIQRQKRLLAYLHACFIADIKVPATVGSSTSSTVHSSTIIAVPHIGSSHNGPEPTAKSKPATTDWSKDRNFDVCSEQKISFHKDVLSHLTKYQKDQTARSKTYQQLAMQEFSTIFVFWWNIWTVIQAAQKILLLN